MSCVVVTLGGFRNIKLTQSQAVCAAWVETYIGEYSSESMRCSILSLTAYKSSNAEASLEPRIEFLPYVASRARLSSRER